MLEIKRHPIDLSLLAKYPDAGDVKTRLAASIGDENALLLYRQMLQSLLENLSSVPAIKTLRRRTLWVAPAHRSEAFGQLIGPWEERSQPTGDRPNSGHWPNSGDQPNSGHWIVRPQPAGDLGVRIRHALMDASPNADPPTQSPPIVSSPAVSIAIGADVPNLELHTIVQAARKAADHDIVLGPASDGGYWLIAVRQPWTERYESLFQEMPWSTPAVAQQTRQRAAAAGLRVAELDIRSDIDDLESLQNFAAEFPEHCVSRTFQNVPEGFQSVCQGFQNVSQERRTMKSGRTNASPVSNHGHLAVVGDGIVGRSVAWEATRRGWAVTLFGRDDVSGCTQASAGILPPAVLERASDPIDRLRGFSHQQFPEWIGELEDVTNVDCQFRQCGGIYIATTVGEAASMTAMQQFYNDMGIEYRVLQRAEYGRVLPSIPASRLSTILALAEAPGECVVTPRRLVSALAAAITARGGELCLRTPVQDVVPNAGRLEIKTARQRRQFDQVVLAGGVRVETLHNNMGIRRAVIPVRGQMLVLRSDGDACTLDRVLNVGNRYLVPRPGGEVLVGSCEEEVGMHDATTETMLDQLRAFASEWFPAMSAAPRVDAWSGLRPMTFDGFPMIGPAPRAAGVWIAAGHFRSGVHLSVATAKCLLDQIEGRTPVVDMDAFRP
ncbi:MAG: FAD-dependent oxidoreductase [Planctomycetota bacterium]